jgi:P-type Cu+ transporter
VLDNTGTKTKGNSELTNIVTAIGFEEDKVFKLAAALECSSEHPLASAVIKSARSPQAC